MLKLIMSVKRLPTLTWEEFDDHWRNRHASLVHRYADLLGIRRYVQNAPMADRAAQMALQNGRGAEPFAFDGCAELWWDDMEAHLAARETPAGRQALHALMEDERRFVDLTRSQLWYAEERTIL